MADLSIEGAPLGTSDLFFGNGIWGPFWLNQLVGAIIYIDGNSDVVARKTTDGGASWGAPAVSENITAVTLSAWFDKQTPGDDGTKVHCAYMNDAASTHRYCAYDISAGTWGTPNTAASPNPSATANSNKSFITKTRNGNILIGGVVSALSSHCFKAASPYTSWTSITNPYETNANDQTLGCSVNTGDGADAGVIFWDISAFQISIKVYDDSANTWTETAISGTAHTSQAAWRQMACTTRLSDGHVLVVAWNAFDVSTADMTSWDINPTSVASVSVTAKTNVINNTDNCAMVAIFIDQFTNDVYVAYGIGGNPTATLSIVYKKSTDGMANWGNQTAYSEDAADDYRVLENGAMGASSGGRFQPAWFDDDDFEIYINLTNDIAFALTSNSERPAKVSGYALTNSERNDKIYAGYANSVNDSFTTTDNKDVALTTAKWSGDGEVTLQ